MTVPEILSDDIAVLRAALLAEREQRLAEAARAGRVEAELAVAQAKAADDAALIAHQRLQIAKLTHQLYGRHAERSRRLIEQMELTFEELESAASEDEITAERAVAKTTTVVGFTRKYPARQPFPAQRTCRASGWSSRRRRNARAAAAPGCANSARTSPRRWK